MQLTSSAFQPGGQIPRENTRDGAGPSPGKPHRYFFKLYALDTELYLRAGSTKSEVESAMKGHILAEAQLMGTYGR